MGTMSKGRSSEESRWKVRPAAATKNIREKLKFAGFDTTYQFTAGPRALDHQSITEGEEMNATENKVKLSDIEFAQLGGGHLAYIREIEPEQASILLGELPGPPGAPLFCLYAADGTPMAISISKQAAMANALANQLLPMLVH
jgi:hypothetical protein